MRQAADVQLPSFSPIAGSEDDNVAEIQRLRRRVLALEYELALADGVAAGPMDMDAERIRAFAEVTSDWFWEMGPDFRFTYCSNQFYQLTGLRPEDRIGATRTQLVDESQLVQESAKWSGHLATLKRRRPFRNFEYAYTTPQGAVRHARISGAPTYDSAGAFQGYRGTGTDITDAVEAREKTDRAQKLFVSAVETLSEAFALFDSDDRMVFCNNIFRKHNPDLVPILHPGVTFEDLVRENVRNGRILEARGREEAYIRERMALHRNPSGTFSSERADGRRLMLREEKAADGATFLVVVDLTEIKLREDALRDAKEKAEQASRSKSNFLTMMSHELRTPLNAIIGFSDVLKHELFGPLGNAQYQGYASDILESGKHLLDLINDILDLSKIEAGKYVLNLVDVDVGALVRRSGQLVREQAREKGIRLRIIVDRNLPSLRADERAVRQILLNLLSNAVKFTPEGGLVRLRVVYGRRGRIRITVYDTGIGIPEGDMETIFMPFAQLADVRHTNFGGTGLGLPIVKSLVDMHGGRLSVKSNRGEWTRMTVEFPESCVIR